MAFDDDDLQTDSIADHYELVRKNKRKPKHPKKKGRPRKHKRVHRVTPLQRALRAVKTRTLYREIARRSYVARWSSLSGEEKKVARERKRALRKLRQQMCDHSKFPPVVRKNGKFKGKLCCRSCNQPIPAQKMGELETVT